MAHKLLREVPSGRFPPQTRAASNWRPLFVRAVTDRYHVVVLQPDHYSWGWEIYRNGQPLPIRLRGGNHGSKSVPEGLDRRPFLRQDKSRKGERESDLKPFVVVQRVQLPPGKG